MVDQNDGFEVPIHRIYLMGTLRGVPMPPRDGTRRAKPVGSPREGVRHV
jgi:hypothetical protein